MPDYAAKLDPPPNSPGRGPASSDIIRNLELAREVHPGEWVRIATYETRGTADTVASDLRRFRRTKRRPAGTFEFRSGQVADGTDFGVWARYEPGT